MDPKLKGRTHIVIGDTQVKEGVPTANLSWIGRYIVEEFWKRDVALIHLGDHWDMPSLSSYDKGKGSMEGRRYKKDIRAGNKAWELLNKPLFEANKAKKNKSREWWPERYFLIGNHEERIMRAVNENPQMEGVIGYHDFNLAQFGWKVQPFLKPLWLDGIAYAHYFYNTKTGKPLGGANLQARLKTIGHSFTMGHQQGLDVGHREICSGRHMGLVLGSSYIHDEHYIGPQGNREWRGIYVCHQVENGQYDRMEVSMNYLCKRYTGKSLDEYMAPWREEQEALHDAAA